MRTFEAKLPRNLRKQDHCDMKQTLEIRNQIYIKQGIKT